MVHPVPHRYLHLGDSRFDSGSVDWPGVPWWYGRLVQQCQPQGERRRSSIDLRQRGRRGVLRYYPRKFNLRGS